MSRRIAATAAALAAAAAALCSTASAAPASAGPPQPPLPVTHGAAVPLPPDEAEALATASAAVPSGETTVPVSPAVALGASSLPGAHTAVESGLTETEAVGLAAPEEARPSPDYSWAIQMCWADRAWWQWGTWPYQQRLVNTTYWCAVYGQRITYRTTTVTTSGTLCGTNWRADQLIGGGIGYHGMTIRASAGFACPTAIPWLTLHPSHHLDVFFGDRGRAVITGSG